jgi:hypothetical protein
VKHSIGKKHHVSKRDNEAIVNKLNYLHMITSPFSVAFAESNVKKGFSKTGIYPLNAMKITPDMMAPSLPYFITYFELVLSRQSLK